MTTMQWLVVGSVGECGEWWVDTGQWWVGGLVGFSPPREPVSAYEVRRITPTSDSE